MTLPQEDPDDHPVSSGARRLDDREAPSLGGFNVTVLRLEIRRLLRNRRTVIFALIFPVVFFLAFGLNKAYANQSAGPGSHGNVSAFIMISMALYGAVLATTSGGAMVSIERAAGWSRQLRLTPLSPVAYIVIKMLTAMVLGLASVVVVFAVGGLTGKPSMPMYLWIVSAACVWIGSLVFAAFGLFMGYLLPTENVMQFLGLGLALLSFAGGLFIPLSQFPQRSCRTSPSSRRSTGSTSSCTRRCSASASSGPGQSTPWPGWSSSPAAPSGGSARTPPGSEPRTGAGGGGPRPRAGHGTARGPPQFFLHRPAGGLGGGVLPGRGGGRSVR